MPYNKASSYLNSDAVIKTSKILLKSSLTTSLIAGIFSLPSLGIARAATSTEEIRTGDRTSIKTNFKAKNQSKAISPNSYNPVASVKTLIADLSSLPSAKNKHLANAFPKREDITSSTIIEPNTANFNRVERATSANHLAVNPNSTTLLAAKPQTRFHIVGRGDTISKIAKKYGVSKDDLVRLNQIKNSNVIFVSQRLEIPTAETTSDQSDRLKNTLQPTTQVTSSVPLKAAHKKRSKAIDSLKQDDRHSTLGEDSHIAKLRANIERLRTSDRDRPQRALPLDRVENNTAIKDIEPASTDTTLTSISTNSQSNSIPQEALALQLPPLPPSEAYLPSAFDGYIWPARGVLTSGYGWRWGRMHRGIDIAAPIGTPIVAAASGEVINAGWHSGYGNLVKLKHLDGSVTLYAHNNKNLVSHGQKVSQGEQIAEMGNTGRSTGSHLHFEIHSADKAAINPLALLGSKR